MDLACPKCGRIYTEGEKCPNCGVALTRDWSGKVAVIDPEKSKIGKEMGINLKGIYALKV